MTTTRPDMRPRQFVLGPERVRATILTTGAETGGRTTSPTAGCPRAR
jgi:hypothetical protein